MATPTSTFGAHLLIECVGCPPERLDDVETLSHALRDAAHAIGAKIVTSAFHRFAPQGVTGFVLLEESHISIHTWPERGYAAVDLFSCGAGDPRAALPLLRVALRAERIELLRIARGRLGEQPTLRTVAELEPTTSTTALDDSRERSAR